MRHFKKSARYNQRFVAVMEQSAKCVDISFQQPRENGSSEFHAGSFQIVAGIEKLIEDRSVRFENRFRAIQNLIDVL